MLHLVIRQTFWIFGHSPSCIFDVIITLVAQVAAIVLVILLTPSSPSYIGSRTNCVSTTSACHHPTFLFFIVEASRRQTCRSRGCSKVIGGDCCGDWGRVGSLDICSSGRPSGSSKARVIQNAVIDVYETFTDSVVDVGQVRRS